MNARVARFFVSALLTMGLAVGIALDSVPTTEVLSANAVTANASTQASAEAAAVAPMGAASSTDTDSTASTTKMKSYPASAFTAAAGQLPAELSTAIKRDLGSNGAKYLARSAAAIDAVAVVRTLKAAGVGVLGARLAATKLVVNVARPADAAAVIRAGAIAVIGAPAAINLHGAVFTAASTPALLSGSGYVFATSGSTGYAQCSVGFNGYETGSGSAQFATAGHCVVGMDATQPVNALTQTAPGVNGSLGDVIGTGISSSGQFGSGYDAGLVAVAEGNTTPLSSAVTWGGGAQSPTASAPLPITSISSAIVDGDLCKSGSRTGWTCGTIEAVDQSVSVSGNDVNSIIASTCALPGDSGGSALAGQTAVGVTSSTSNASVCDANSFSTYFPMISDAGGASVAAKYSTAWEAQVTVATPVIGAATGGTTAAPGTITGTLGGASATSKVRIFLDGSSTPAVIVAANTGNWSAQLPSMSAGSHTFTAVGSWGVWSRSIAATGTVNIAMAGPFQPVYRFWSATFSSHFYTISTVERDAVIARYPGIWAYEGPVYQAFTTQVAGSVPLYRFWSDTLKGHFYTADEAEKNQVIARWPGIWHYEAVAYYVYPLDTTEPNTETVARFWSPVFHHHFYSANPAEIDQVKTRYPTVWSWEGPRFRVPTQSTPQ
ncbi:MAG: hypothetical protein H7248_01950 [Microbacteriaceae bacterium]|nr:hypothetical protein [Microbacteriaceae bacterium]